MITQGWEPLAAVADPVRPADLDDLDDLDGTGRPRGPHPGSGADVHLPVEIALEALPGRVGPGGTTEFLVMVANSGPCPLGRVRLGLVVPPGVEVSSVTPPAGAVAVAEHGEPGDIVRTRLPGLAPWSCVGLAVGIRLPDEPRRDSAGPYRVVAFVDSGTTEGSLTCEHLLEVAATG